MQALWQVLALQTVKIPRIEGERKHILQFGFRFDGNQQPFIPLQADVVCKKCTPENKTPHLLSVHDAQTGPLKISTTLV